MLDQAEVDRLQQIIGIREGRIVELGASGPPDRGEDDARRPVAEPVPGLEVALNA